MKCEKCGYDNDADAAFCEQCGAKLSENAAFSDPLLLKRRIKSINTKLLVAIVALVVILGVTSGILLKMWSSSPTANNTSNNETISLTTGFPCPRYRTLPVKYPGVEWDSLPNLPWSDPRQKSMYLHPGQGHNNDKRWANR